MRLAETNPDSSGGSLKRKSNYPASIGDAGLEIPY